MRAYFSTGEASGDLLAAELASAIRTIEPASAFEGIGSERMEAAGIRLRARTIGWASLGPLEALARIPPLLVSMLRTAFRLRADPPDLIVLVDFGAYNLRLASFLRAIGYDRAILYFFPPGAWLDDPARARKVARTSAPLTAFDHQRAFYAALGLPIAYFGHPLVSLVAPRAPRAPAPARGGRVAILPGSRKGELRRHLGPLLGAARRVRERRPDATFVIAAADAAAVAEIERALAAGGVAAEIVRGSRAALDDADAAWIASGTAVLEAVLREVPTVALYVIARSQIPIAKRIWNKPYITLPNILLGRVAVPELLQDDATPQALADAVETLLDDPRAQLAAARDVRERLGPPDALERCARYALELARA